MESSCSKEQPMALHTSSSCSSKEVADRKPNTDLEVMLVVAVQAADFFSARIPLTLFHLDLALGLFVCDVPLGVIFD